MSDPVDEALVSADTRPIPALVDTQVRVLAMVLAANVREGLRAAIGAEKWLEAAVVDWYDYPITLGLLADARLPAISVWRVKTSVAGPGQRRDSRRATFGVRYWLDSTTRDLLPRMWPALHAAQEVMTRTLTGEGLIDLDMPGVKKIPSTDLLGLAGFEFIYPETIVGQPDFASAADGEVGQVFPVLELTFDAQHYPVFGGLPYPQQTDLPLLEQLCVALWDGTPVGGRAPEDQPMVEIVATAPTLSLEERSRALLGGQS